MADHYPSNRMSIRRHKLQVTWQVIIPFIFVLGGISIAATFVVTGKASQTRLWADISIIWVIAPIILMTLLGIAVLSGMIYAIARLRRALPRYTSGAQVITARINSGVTRVANEAMKPVLWIQQAGTAARTIMHKVGRNRDD